MHNICSIIYYSSEDVSRDNIKASLGAFYSLPLTFSSTPSKLYFNIHQHTPRSNPGPHYLRMPPSVPPAPQLPQQALQEVFTYPDSSRDPVPGNKFSGARRLEIIGSPIAETVYMDVMRLRWPGASAAQLLVSPHPIHATTSGQVLRLMHLLLAGNDLRP